MDKYKTYIIENGYNNIDNYYKKGKDIEIIKGFPENNSTKI